MAKRFVALVATVLFGLTLATDGSAKQPKLIGSNSPGGIREIDQDDYFYDVPLTSSTHARGGIDTVYWGGINASGLGVKGGTWDFEGSIQGWQSIDLTDLVQTIGVVPIRRVTTTDFLPPNSNATMTDGGSAWSVWMGAFHAETTRDCWPGGQGYSNGWGLNMSKVYTYGGTSTVTIDLDYFTDSETQFDYTYVYVINDEGIRSTILNHSDNGHQDDREGYSGSAPETTNLGTPAAPAHETIVVDTGFLPTTVGGEFEVLINFDSDPLYSDGLDSFPGFLNTVVGAFGVDDIHLTGVALNDLTTFEPAMGGINGWDFRLDPPIGNQMKRVALGNLDPPADPCGCPLLDNVMVASIVDPMSPLPPHPKKQNEEMSSPACYVGAVEDRQYSSREFIFDAWLDLPISNGVGFRIAYHFYPWVCPTDPGALAQWTIEPADHSTGGYVFLDPAQCGTFVSGTPGGSPNIPFAVDSLKLVFELIGDCDDFGTDPCTGPAQTNQSPYFDNIRLVAFGAAGLPAPPRAVLDLIYQDVYPQTNTLLPNAAADIHALLDNNRADLDRTNANMSDSAVVLAGTNPATEVYLNFRVYPGPQTNTGNAWFSKYGANFIAPGGVWAEVRMDTAEVGTGQLSEGAYMSYEHEVVSGGAEFVKIIPDGVLTPGSTVEYFFSVSNSTPTRSFSPDTSDATYLEFEVLPGYFEVAGDILAPCMLYVDGFGPAQRIIEERALRNIFGQTTDDDALVHDRWDRYDYFGAGSNVPGPLAREVNGNNGMTGYQSMLYKTVLYNTGGLQQEGLRDGDAALLQNFLISDDFERELIPKGLWLSGNGMGTILSRTTRPNSNQLLASFAGANQICDTYRDPGCGVVAGDSSVCVRLDAAPLATFSPSGGYSARGNGCPSLFAFDVLGLSGPGVGNLVYIDQDAGLTPTSYASISNDQFATPGNYGVVIDGFSLHYLRTSPVDFALSDCGTDSTGVFTRATDVFGFLNADTSPGTCDPDPLITGVDGGVSPTPAAFTRLFQNSPNPFNPQTSVRYQLHDKALVKLQVFDVSGKLVRTLVEDVQEFGQYSITWDGTADTGREVSSGVYWARMSTSLGFQASTKMVVLK